MGIPKFFRYIVKQDPDLVTDKIEDVIQNIYFDLNCLIYPCVKEVENEHQNLVSQHNLDVLTDKYNKLSYTTSFEKKLYKSISDYILKIVEIVKPTESVYLSIDGVAPRAKMEQQRMRRYRSVKINRMKNEIYKKYDKIVHTFDTNCISPGTLFMSKLSIFLQKFCNEMMESLNLTIYLDDASNRGEGEHKILQHIKKYKVDDINCIYGLDADLIMLSLVSKSKNYLLRESIHFNKMDRENLLYFNCERFGENIYKTILEIVNEHTLEVENEDLCDTTDIHDKQRIINDYICLCFMIGNDFLPEIKGLDINLDSIESIIQIYAKILNIRRKFLVYEDFTINFIFIRQILLEIFNKEEIIISKYYSNIEKRRITLKQPDDFGRELEKLDYLPFLNKKKRKIEYTNIKDWYNSYYKYYFHIENYLKDYNNVEEICKNYVEGLQWNIKYYLEDCVCYSWYYMYRAAPVLKDLCNYLSNRVYPAKFENDEILPLEQLAIIMPIQSKHLWSKEYSKIATTNLTSILDYPIDFELDIENKIYTHECDPILNNIDYKKIKKIYSTLYLSDVEKKLNSKSDIFVYQKTNIKLDII